MKKNRKIYIVGNDRHYCNWMQPTEIVDNLEDADLVVFTGGADVDPQMYKEKEPKHPATGSMIERDKHEAQIFLKAVRLKKHIIGICRGSQFLCVMNGGRLVQHQNNPHFIHDMQTYDLKRLLITSTHHQAQYPWNLPKDNYKILGYTNNISRFHEDGSQQEMPMAQVKEVEMAYYPRTHALAIQGHPEMMLESSATITYLRNLLDKHMKDVL